MKEAYTGKDIEVIVGGDNLKYLFDMMNHPGWDVMKMANKAIKADWIEQTANIDLTSKTDTEMLRTLRTRNGMIKGVDMLIHYLETKRTKVLKRAEDEAAEQEGSTEIPK